MQGSAGEGALHHYIEIDEKSGFRPAPVFDPAWYVETYHVDTRKETALAHYLRNRHTSLFDLNAYFDAHFYLETYPDLRDAPIDAFSHLAAIRRLRGPRWLAEIQRRVRLAALPGIR